MLRRYIVHRYAFRTRQLRRHAREGAEIVDEKDVLQPEFRLQFTGVQLPAEVGQQSLAPVAGAGGGEAGPAWRVLSQLLQVACQQLREARQALVAILPVAAERHLAVPKFSDGETAVGAAHVCHDDRRCLVHCCERFLVAE